MFRHMRYHRNKNRSARGLIIVEVDPNSGKAAIGWSLCSKEDSFDKVKAKLIAEGRLKSGKINYNTQDFDPKFIDSLIYSDDNGDYINGTSVPHSMRFTLHLAVADVNHRVLKIKESQNVATGQ